MTFFLYSRVQSVYSVANWSLFSNQSYWLFVFWRLHSCSVPSPWVPFTLCVWKRSYFHNWTYLWVLLLFFNNRVNQKISDHDHSGFRTMTIGEVWGSVLWSAHTNCPFKTKLAVAQFCVGVCICGGAYISMWVYVGVCVVGWFVWCVRASLSVWYLLLNHGQLNPW